MNFHRYYEPNQIVFITQVVHNRMPAFKNPQHLDLLIETLRNVKELHPFDMLAYVFLSDHFHILIKPTGKTNFSQIMHSLKYNFTNSYKQILHIEGRLKFWQKRFWDHIIRDEKDLANHIHYIHYNPIKHGYVDDMSVWKYSSFKEWQQRGAYPENYSWQEPTDVKWGE
jgi:putative transposase